MSGNFETTAQGRKWVSKQGGRNEVGDEGEKKEAVQRQILNYLKVAPKVPTQRFSHQCYFLMFLKLTLVALSQTPLTESDSFNREDTIC